MFNELVHKIPSKVLIDLYKHPKSNISELTRRLNSHFATISEAVDSFTQNKLIRSAKVGRNRILSLTVKGKNIARSVLAIRSVLS